MKTTLFFVYRIGQSEASRAKPQWEARLISTLKKAGGNL